MARCSPERVVEIRPGVWKLSAEGPTRHSLCHDFIPSRGSERLRAQSCAHVGDIFAKGEM
jgi:hypothetical protein